MRTAARIAHESRAGHGAPFGVDRVVGGSGEGLSAKGRDHGVANRLRQVQRIAVTEKVDDAVFAFRRVEWDVDAHTDPPLAVRIREDRSGCADQDVAVPGSGKNVAFEADGDGVREERRRGGDAEEPADA
jgi:hypothetical protein